MAELNRIIHEDYVEIIIQRRNLKQYTVLIDREDLPMIFGYSIQIVEQRPGRFYAKISGFGKEAYLHRHIMNTPKCLIVDHGNDDCLDNRKFNLTNCTDQENKQNLKPYVRSKSGIRGVSFDKSRDKWCAVVGTNHLGRFSTMSEAEKIVTEYRAKHMPFSKEARSD